MILVSVRDQDGPQIPQALPHVADIRNDEVNAALPFLRELAAAVDDDEVVPVLDGRHVLADLADSPEWDDPEAAAGIPSRRTAAGLLACRRSRLSARFGRRGGCWRSSSATVPLVGGLPHLNVIAHGSSPSACAGSFIFSVQGRYWVLTRT